MKLMKREKTKIRIAWAVDAFAGDKPLLAKAVAALKSWSRGREVVIEPVFVLAPQQVYFPLDVYAYVAPNLREEAKRGLVKLLRGVPLPGMLPPVVLETDNFSLRGAVTLFMEHARRSGADLVVSTTLSKTGTTRFLFGSFAETLVQLADVPVFLVSPKARTPKSISRVLFPTDLSDESKEALLRVAALCAGDTGHLTLFHEVEYLNRYTEQAVKQTPAYQKLVDEDLLRRRRAVEALALEARALGARVDVVMSLKGRKAADAILSTARRGSFDAIAMASHAGSVTAAVLGSVTRAVLRGADCPVWVLHPADRAATGAKTRPAGRIARRAALA